MEVATRTTPRFMGATLAEHALFVVALCRYQHHSLTLSFIHYLTWSAMHVGLYALALVLFGSPGALVIGGVIVAWALRVDWRIGLLFGLIELACALSANALVPGGAVTADSSWMAAAIAFGGMVTALIAEVAGHLVVQGYPPGPPARILADMPKGQMLAFIPYFVVAFGMFFLTLDLAMRLLGYRKQLHEEANAVSAQWHHDAIAAGVPTSREGNWHRRALAEQS